MILVASRLSWLPVNKQQKYLPDYLTFTRKERTGIIVIGCLIVIFTFIPFLFPFFNQSKPADDTAFEKEITALRFYEDSGAGYTERKYGFEKNNYFKNSSRKDNRNQPVGELFYFDPNSLPIAGWVKLGISERTAASIQKYTSKGGRFYRAEDIGKIWGLHPDQVERLLPFVRIEKPPGKVYEPRDNRRPYQKQEWQARTFAPVDVNLADTAAFIVLPGIGSRLAQRIINFRTRLGGFYEIGQIGETYALPDSTFGKIKKYLILGSTAVKQLNINTATKDALKAHPYIRYNYANAIVEYREQHGKFESVSDLKRISIVTDEFFNKVLPYLNTR